MKKHLSLPLEEKTTLLTDLLLRHKALHPVALRIQSAWAEALIITGAGSARHAQALADEILAWCREHNVEFLNMEGYHTGQWILVDLNDVVIHIFQPHVRELYRMESLWASRRDATSQEPAA